MHRLPFIPAPRIRKAFTLVELIVSMAVLVVIIIMISQLLNSAQRITGNQGRQMDADAQAGAVFDRMSIDFAQMVKRPDVDYFLKEPANPQTGNDQLAFYSQVPGYYPASFAGSRNPVSLIAYRVGPVGTDGRRLQRYGCGLAWSASSPQIKAVVFSSASLSAAPNTISENWPAATGMGADNDYELAGPQVFRMEYRYLLKGRVLDDGTVLPSLASAVPWDIRVDHDAVHGLRDVAAIAVTIAVIDPKSRHLVSDQELAALVTEMDDFSDSMAPGDLEAQWQSAIDGSGLHRAAASAIRIYRRYFHLPPEPLL